MPAAAHAWLVACDPPDGTRLPSAPAQVTLTFSENVSLGVGFVRVVDQRGDEADAGPAQHPSGAGDVVAVRLRPGLPSGGYLVSYQVVSADSHPISGATAFTVGDGPLLDAAGAVLDGTGTDPVVGLLLTLARWVSYAGLALLGGVVFVRVCWPGGRLHRRVRRLIWIGWSGVALATVAELLGQGPYAAGRGVAALAPAGALRATLSLPVGQVLLLRLAVLAVLGVLVSRLLSGRGPGSRYEDLGGVAGLVLLLTYAGAGHAVADAAPTLAMIADTLHIAAMAVWLGGLVVLVGGLLRLAGPEEVATALPRFSRLAFGAVSVLVATGLYRAVGTVGTPAALWSTGYGRLLSVKVLAVVALLAVANLSRRAVRQRSPVPPAAPQAPQAQQAQQAPQTPRPEAGGRALRRLRRSVGFEALLAVVVLALTAVLVSQPPARLAQRRPVQASVDLGGTGSAGLWLSPGRAGSNDLRLRLTSGGRPVEPLEVTLTVALPAEHLGPLRVPLESTGPGGYRAAALSLPEPGRWMVTVRVRTSEFDATVGEAALPVR